MLLGMLDTITTPIFPSDTLEISAEYNSLKAIGKQNVRKINIVGEEMKVDQPTS